MSHILKGDGNNNFWLDGEELDPEESQKVYNHSPDGFSCGYGGSGPSQLALAITLKLTGNQEGYQDLKWAVVSRVPQDAPFEVEFDIDTIIKRR